MAKPEDRARARGLTPPLPWDGLPAPSAGLASPPSRAAALRRGRDPGTGARILAPAPGAPEGPVLLRRPPGLPAAP